MILRISRTARCPVPIARSSLLFNYREESLASPFSFGDLTERVHYSCRTQQARNHLLVAYTIAQTAARNRMALSPIFRPHSLRIAEQCIAGVDAAPRDIYAPIRPRSHPNTLLLLDQLTSRPAYMLLGYT